MNATTMLVAMAIATAGILGATAVAPEVSPVESAEAAYVCANPFTYQVLFLEVGSSLQACVIVNH